MASRVAKGRGVPLRATTPAVASTPILLAPLLAAVRRHLRDLRDRTDPEALHRLRIGIARLRAALAACRDVVDAESRRALDDELRWLRRELTAARDWQIFVEACPAAATKGASLVRRAAVRRRRAEAHVRQALNRPRSIALAAQLRRPLPLMPRPPAGASSLGSIATHAINRCLRKLRRRARHLDRLDTDGLHRLRLAVKRLRYTAELFRSLYPEPCFACWLHAMAQLQDALGDVQDRAIARQLAGQLAIGTDVGMPHHPHARPGRKHRRRVRNAWAIAVAASASTPFAM